MNDSPAFFNYLKDIRRELHQHPELSGKEIETAKRVCRELNELGISYKSGVGGHGVIAEIPGEASAPFIALRADMDALPIQEETGLPFASQNDGVMHACGHDFHTTALLGAAKLLKEETLSLPIRLIFQPAEEIAAGAKAMIEAGALEDVAAIYGGHVDKEHEPGTIVIQEGAVGASSYAFKIRIQGKGSHGARPHQSVDAILIASALVQDLQSIISREVSPADPAVLSIGKFIAGSAPNVIAGTALLEGTIRTHSASVHKAIVESIERRITFTGKAYGAKLSLELRNGTPVIVNSPEQTALAVAAAEKTIGAAMIRKFEELNMGGEDFGFYLEKVPGAFVRFGTQTADGGMHPAHSSKFDTAEAALPVAAKFLTQLAVEAGSVLAVANKE